MTAVTLVPDPPVCVLGGGKTCGVTTVVLFYSVVLVPVPVDSPGGGGFVGWEPHSGRVQSCSLRTRPAWVQTLLKDRLRGVVCGVSYRPISTGQLHESLVLASTSGLSTQWSGWGPLTPEGVWKSHLEASFPLRCFQRLSHPNVANQRCTWQYN